MNILYPFLDEKISEDYVEKHNCVVGNPLPFTRDEFCSMTGKSSGEVGSFTYRTTTFPNDPLAKSSFVWKIV